MFRLELCKYDAWAIGFLTGFLTCSCDSCDSRQLSHCSYLHSHSVGQLDYVSLLSCCCSPFVVHGGDIESERYHLVRCIVDRYLLPPKSWKKLVPSSLEGAASAAWLLCILALNTGVLKNDGFESFLRHLYVT